MFFCGDDTSGFTRRPNNGLFVYWLDGVNVYDLRIDAKLCQLFARLYSFPNQMASSENTYVYTFIDHPGFSNLELLIRISKNRDYRAPKPQVNRAVMIGNSDCSGFGLIIVAWVDYRHPGQHFH